MINVIKGFDDALEKVSRYGLIISLFVILVFAVLAIILRWIGHSVMWVEPMVRHVVFLSAFFGGSLATSANVHIRVDLLTKAIEASKSKKLLWLQHNLLALFCFLVTLVLTFSAYDFFKVEQEFGAPAFLNIHSSYLVGIIPFGMGLICLRFLNQLILGLVTGGAHERTGV
jgi:TRAP-type C4-dicarboxylate transport system permease small subunit